MYEWHQAEFRGFANDGKYERTVGLHALETSVHAHADEAELVTHAPQLRDTGRAMERLDDAERGREAAPIGVPVRSHAVVDAAGVRNAVGPEIAVTGDHDRLIDPLAIHRRQATFDFDGGRILAGRDAGEREALCFERSDVVMAVDHGASGDGHELSSDGLPGAPGAGAA